VGEGRVRDAELRLPDALAERVRPRSLRVLDPPERRATLRGEANELRSAMVGVRHQRDEALSLECVGHPLDALPREAPRARDLRDRHRRALDGGEDTPSRRRLTGRPGERVAGGGEQTVQAEHVDDQLAERFSCRGPGSACPRVAIASMLSCSYPVRHDSILSSRAGGRGMTGSVRPAFLGPRALNRATLARQSLLGRAERSVAHTIEHLVGMQAQIPRDPYVGLWTRLEGFRPEELSILIRDRLAVRASLMRATLHLVTAGDLVALRPVIRPVLERVFRSGSPFGRRLRATGADLDAVIVAGEALVEERPRTSAELRAHLGGRWPDHDAEALAMAVTTLVPVVQVPPRGMWDVSGRPTWAGAEAWLGARFDAGATVDDVMLRYLAAFGPASVMDAQTWCGLTRLGEVFERLGPRVRAFRDDHGRALFDLPDAPRPDGDVPAPVRFLPVYDNLLLGYADRSRVLGQAARKRLFGAGVIGNVGPVLVGGTVRATWRIVPHGDGTEAVMSIEPFERLGRQDLAAVSEEGARLLGFFASDAERRDVRIARHS
jgi:hypothetical protein